MTAASWRFRSVCEEDFDKVLNDCIVILEQLDDFLSISMRDSPPLNFLRFLLIQIDHVMR